MLTKLTMKCFRKHTDTTIRFTRGINAIRAANEAGKSTAISAICYALFGARALPEPLEDVVTYDVPLSKLKVELELEFAGVPYRLTRGKSGAELYANGNDTPLVTGQTEVTKYVERLLGASQDMAAKLMLAKQKDLGGALADGPTAAGKLIEELANLGLIEELVGLVSDKLPSGRTDAAEALARLQRSQQDVTLADTTELQEAVQVAQAGADDATRELERLLALADDLDVNLARGYLTKYSTLGERLAAAQQREHSLVATVDKPLPVAPDAARLAELPGLVEQEKQYAAIARTHAQLVAAGIEPAQWDTSHEALLAEVASTTSKISSLTAEIAQLDAQERKSNMEAMSAASRLREDIVRLEGRLIKEESCALCGKDLKDVPEVARVNNPLSAEIAALKGQLETTTQQAHAAANQLEAQRAALQTQLAEQAAYAHDLSAVEKAAEAAERWFAKAERYITVDRSVVPGRWQWTGPEIGGQRPDYAGELARLQREQQAWSMASASRAAAQGQLADVRTEMAALAAERDALPRQDAQDTLDQYAALQPQIAAARTAGQAAGAKLQQAQQALFQTEATNRAALELAEKARNGLKETEDLLAEMGANNALIKKLREARPKITDKLWTMVLAAVSTYLSEVRGEPSQVTRADGRFLVNGRPVSGLSGSAEDVLGLANRLGLTKMFLPNVDFLILDEVAAACDDARETAMLGLLATVGFDQVVLVTHSPLADSFANNIITF